MAHTIWKFRLDLAVNDIEMPRGAHVLHVNGQPQGTNKLFAWVLVDDTQPKVKHRICIYGTGHGVKMNGGEDVDYRLSRFVNTFQIPNKNWEPNNGEPATFVFHAFDAGDLA